MVRLSARLCVVSLVSFLGVWMPAGAAAQEKPDEPVVQEKPVGAAAQAKPPDPVVTKRSSPVDDTDFGDPAPTLGFTLKQVPRDFAHFWSRDTALTLGLGGAAALAVHPVDDDVHDAIAESTRLEDFFDAGNVYGSFAVQLGGAFGVYTIGRLGAHAHLSTLGGDLIRAQLLTAGYTQALKFATDRERPDGSNSQSFPSGHASAAFATANVIRRHYGWGWGSLGYGLAAYVASARLAHDRHYLSDVVFGAAIGIAGGRTVTVSHDRHRATIGAVPTAGGVAVRVSID